MKGILITCVLGGVLGQCSAHESQKSALDSLEVELQAIQSI